VKTLIHEQLAAANTYAAKNIQNKREELNIIDGPCEAEVTEMSRAVVICLAATAARLSII
jgi:hypothetical protein